MHLIYPEKDNFAQLIKDTPVNSLDFVVKGIIGPKEGIQRDNIVADAWIQYSLPGILKPSKMYDEINFIVSNNFFVFVPFLCLTCF